MAEATRILVADDHPLYRDALVSAIGGLNEDCQVSVSGSFNDAMEKLADEEFDLVLLDLQMPGSQGLSGLAQLRAHYPSAPVVIVSATEDTGTIRRSLAMGAAGYVPKSSSIDEMREAVRLVLLGEVYVPENIDPNSGASDEESELIERLRSLTPQQTRVLGMLGEGLLNKQIAYELGVSEATVKAHVSAILLKLRVDSRTQAVIQLGKLGATAEAVMANGSSDQSSA